MARPPDTDRLQFREVRADDAAHLVPILMDPEVMRFWPRPFTREDVDDWISKMLERYDRDGQTYWLAERRDSGVVIGHVGLLRQHLDGVDEIGLGYVFAKEHWGKGFATEASKASLAFGFETLGLTRIVAAIRPENMPSLRVAERLAMEYEKSCEYYGFEHAIFVKSRDS